jgi:hypothetical protein
MTQSQKRPIVKVVIPSGVHAKLLAISDGAWLGGGTAGCEVDPTVPPQM